MTPPLFKWTVRVVAVLFGVVLLAAAILAIIMNTHAGTRWTLARIDAALPGHLVVDDFDGTLLRGLAMPSLRYRDETVDVHVERLSLDIDWSTLPAARLTLALVDADAVTIHKLTESAPAPLQVTVPTLPLNVTVQGAVVDRLVLVSAGTEKELNELGLRNARLDATALRLSEVSASIAGTRISVARFAADLTGDIPASARVEWQLEDGDWRGEGGIRGTLRELAFEQTVSGPYPGIVVGTVALLDRIEPEFDGIVNWEAWSFNDIAVADGELRLVGVIGQYSAEFEARVSASRGLGFDIAGYATGSPNGLDSLDASLSGPAGSARVSGTMAWLPGFVADLDISVKDAVVEEFVESLSGSVSATARVAIDDELNVSVSTLRADGTINGYRASGRGDLDWSPDAQQCRSCELNIGNNRLRVAGSLRGETIDARIDFEGDSLDQLRDDLAGRARVNGRLTGTLGAPAWTGNAIGHSLAFGDWQADQAELTSRAASAEIVDISLAAINLRSAGVDLGSFSVTGRGSSTDLGFEVDWSIRDLAVLAGGRLRPTEDGFSGRLERSSFTEVNTGTWRLAGPFGFRYADTGLSVDPHSWINGESRLELRALQWQPDTLDIAASLAGLPLALANPWLPAHLRLLGRADASIDLRLRADQWSGSVEWRQDDTILRAAEIHDEVTDVRIPIAELVAKIENNALDARAVVSIEPGIRGELDLGLAALTADAPVEAELRLRGDDWAWISAVFPQIDALAGSVEGRITARGPLDAPELEGDAVWRDGRLIVPALNVPLRDIELRLAGGTQGSATLAGTARAGDGKLSLSGRFEDLMLPERTVRLELSGATALLIDWPDYRVWASPELVITSSPAGWRFDGSVAVPRAEIEISELPEEAVTVSPDVTVSGAEPSERERTRLSGEALLTIGDRVRVSALGLDTGLAGEMRIRLLQDRPLAAEGKVILVDGKFAAYGQELSIRDGILTFTGPLDDPLVDATAVRVINTIDGEVTAGIRLRGRAKNLTTTVFAEPAMADSDALSYLVLGRPLNEATQTEGTDLSGAALSLGIKQAARLTEQIGQSLRLDQLSLAGDGGDSTALIAGKQINSRLYARYAYGVFSRLGVLLLRYRMSERLTLEAATGENQSIDVLYSVEKP